MTTVICIHYLMNITFILYVGQNSVVPDHTLEKEAIEKFLTGGFLEASVVKQVTNGKNAMPAFGGRLSDEDIANVATYVIATSEAGWE